jgi:hypothetical protein
MRMRILLVVATVICIAAAPVWAEGILDKNTHMFAPTVDNSGAIVTYGSEPLGMLKMAYGVYVDTAMMPVRAEIPPSYCEGYEEPDPDNNTYKPGVEPEVPVVPCDEEVNLIEQQTGATLYWSIGLLDHFNLGFAAPMIAYRSFDADYDNEDSKESIILEDIRFDVKALLLNRRRHFIGLGLVNTVTLALYEEDNFASDRGTTVAPRLLFDMGRDWWSVAMNAGYKYYANPNETVLYEDYTIGDEIVLNLGANFRFEYDQELVLDSAVKTLAEEAFSNADGDYIEVMAAYRKYWHRLNYNCLTLGAGVGVTEGVGTPLARLFVGFGRSENRLSYVVSQ